MHTLAWKESRKNWAMKELNLIVVGRMNTLLFGAKYTYGSYTLLQK